MKTITKDSVLLHTVIGENCDGWHDSPSVGRSHMQNWRCCNRFVGKSHLFGIGVGKTNAIAYGKPFGEAKKKINRGHISSKRLLSNMQVFVLVVKASHECCCSLKRHYPCERCPFRLRHFVCTFCKLFTNSIETKLTRSRRIKELKHCAVGVMNVTSHKAPKTTAVPIQ